MRSIEILQKELTETQEELKTLCKINSKLFSKGCCGQNGNEINTLIRKEYNLHINLNQAKQKLLFIRKLLV